MEIKLEKRDLFTVPQGYYLAHCISSDFALGAGIAKQFDEVFNMKKRLNDAYGGIQPRKSKPHLIGKALMVGNVFNLVTKDRCWEKPTYESLKASLVDLKNRCEEYYVKKLAMPQIGCGLDKLSWDIVLPIIKDTFEDTDLEILICYL